MHRCGCALHPLEPRAEGGAARGAADELAPGIVDEEAVAARLAGKEELPTAKSGGESPEAGMTEQVPGVEGKPVAESPTPSAGGARDLPETPPRIKISENDRRFGDVEDGPAHTLARHGPDIPLRRADAPAGARTIEGRLFGDRPWPYKAPYSYRWKNKGKLDDLINEYIQKNWDELRVLFRSATEQEVRIDAKQAIGEGFFDAAKGTPVPKPVYHQTSRLAITLKFSAGPPPEIYVVTAYPLGAPR
ncbi:MAG TPA: hypothetical protein PLA94_24955 [Myxococcota bacterium]|nr:hypothetical protein [Myxococcota bacterium]